MSYVQFKVQFGGDVPAGLNVGDELLIAGRVTVQSISGDLIDITDMGDPDQRVTLGGISVNLFANYLEVQEP